MKETTRPICRGHGVHTPERFGAYITAALIIVPSALFFAFPVRYFIVESSNYAILLVTVIILFFSLMTLARTKFTDPGILPSRPAISEDRLEEYAKMENINISDLHESKEYILNRRKPHIIHGKTIYSKWCYTCNIWRSPRASHCTLCNVCVDELDHHCPW